MVPTEGVPRIRAVEVIGRSLPEMDLSDAACLDQLSPFLDNTTAIIICAAVKRQFGDTTEAYHKNMAIVENIIAGIRNELPFPISARGHQVQAAPTKHLRLFVVDADV